MGVRSRCLARSVRSVTRREASAGEAEGPPYTESGGLIEAELAAVVEIVAAEDEEADDDDADAEAKERGPVLEAERDRRG